MPATILEWLYFVKPLWTEIELNFSEIPNMCGHLIIKIEHQKAFFMMKNVSHEGFW